MLLSAVLPLINPGWTGRGQIDSRLARRVVCSNNNSNEKMINKTNNNNKTEQQQTPPLSLLGLVNRLV
jgi:hypothetical protein